MPLKSVIFTLAVTPFLCLFTNATQINLSRLGRTYSELDYPVAKKLNADFPNSLLDSYKKQTSYGGPNIVKKIFDGKDDIVIVSAPLDPFLSEHINNEELLKITNAVEEGAVSIIKRIPPGAEMRVSIFALSSQRMYDEIYKSAQKGVLVKLLYSQAFGTRPELKSQILSFKNKFDRLKDSHRKYRNLSFERCSTSEIFGGCMGIERNHNKFILADKLCRLPSNESGCVNELGQTENFKFQNVVFQSTMNFTESERHQHNMAMIFFNRSSLFNSLKSYHTDMVEKVKKPRLEENYGRVFDVSFPREMAIKLYTSPTKIDYAEQQLEKIRCVKESNPNDTKDSIRIIMGHWEGRSKILELLKKHKKDGCALRVILPNKALNTNEPMHTVYKQLQRANIKVHLYPIDYFGGVHSKLVLINARYDGSNNLRKIVLWGSHNFTHDAIYYNDETWYEMEGSNDNLFNTLARSFYKFREKIEEESLELDIDE